jgi:hypothetical protein
MKHLVMAALSLLAFFSPPGAQAQGPYVRPGMYNPYSRPAYSPYLNLLRPGVPPAYNYYGLVRPQEEFRTDIGQLGQQQNALQQNLSNVENTQSALITGFLGNRSQFMNYSRYFLNNFSGGVGQSTLGRRQSPLGQSSMTTPTQSGGRSGRSSAARPQTR